LQLPGGDEFGDLLLERLANAFDVRQARLGDDLPNSSLRASIMRAAF
jgi:hypothetical protein